MDGISPHGKTDPAIVREILSRKLGSQTATNADIATVLDSYISFLKEEVYTSTTYRVLPGVQSLLDQIVARGDALVGLATGNIELGARIKLERGGLNPYFSFGGFGSDAEDRTELVRKAAEKAAHKNGGFIAPSYNFVFGGTPLDIDSRQQPAFKTVWSS